MALPLREESLEMIVSNLLHAIGIPTHISGFRYLRDAIILAVYDEDMMKKVTKVLYPTVAKKNGTTSSKVERAIRHAIGQAWERGSLNRLEELFGSEMLEKKQRPTNSEFIALVSDKIRLDWKNRNY